MVSSPPPGVNDDPSDDTPFEALSEHSLKAAGYAYLVGDAGLFASGMAAGRFKEATSGLWWGIGGLACAKYANPNAEKQLELLSRGLGEYLRQQGVAIPDTPDTKSLTAQGGLVDHIEEFLYKYPSQILNTTYAVGAAQLIRSGIQHGKPWDAASGALVAAGALSGLLIQEKKPDPAHPPKSAIGKAFAWFQEKPLRLSGGLYALNNATLIMSALAERKANPGQKSYMFKFLTAASYIFGNTMLAISSKNAHESDASKEAMDKLADISARVIASQHPELRQALVQQIAGYLSSQPEVHLKAEEIGKLLHDKMNGVATGMAGQPATGSWQQRLYDQNDLPIMPQL